MIDNNIFGALLAFCIGAAIAAVNYGISRYVLKKHPDKYAFTTMIRMVLQVGFLVAVYFLGGYTPWDTLWLLAGGVIGITLPMFWFTYRLVKLNDEAKDRAEQKGKEGPSDG